MKQQLTSVLAEEFFDTYRKLPKEIKVKVKETYKIWQNNNFYPSLHFKLITANVWSVRIIGHEGYRALGIVKNDICYWFWVGTHDEYMRELK